jgi:nucleotide-binding universal stress UspA family protein
VVERPQSLNRGRSFDLLDWRISTAEAKAYLEAVAKRLEGIGVEAETAIVEGQAAEQVIEFSRSRDVGLIILSSHGQSGLSGWNVSSVVQKIIMRACVPTMIARAYQPSTADLTGLRYRRLLVPLDGSQRAECVLPPATTLARSQGARVVLAHVTHRPELPRRVPPAGEDLELVNRLTERNRQEAASYLEELRARLPVETETRLVVEESVAASLHQLVDQEGVDLVVLSAHGSSGGMKWPYGSVAVSFIAYGTTPLLIVQDLSPDELERSLAELATREMKGH